MFEDYQHMTVREVIARLMLVKDWDRQFMVAASQFSSGRIKFEEGIDNSEFWVTSERDQ